MELFPLAPSQGSRTCARWPLCLALGVVRRRMYLAAVASPTERPLRVVHPFLVPQCLKEPGLPSPDKLREYANVGSFRWSVLGRGMFIHASASGTRLQQNAHLRRVFLKKEEFHSPAFGIFRMVPHTTNNPNKITNKPRHPNFSILLQSHHTTLNIPPKFRAQFRVVEPPLERFRT